MARITSLETFVSSLLLSLLTIICAMYATSKHTSTATTPTNLPITNIVQTTNDTLLQSYGSAAAGLQALSIMGRAPKTGYSRSQFGEGWNEVNDCNTRNRILARDLKQVTYDINNCVVMSGTLTDPYSDIVVQFSRGDTTSSDVQIDHVVSLSNAWQTGAQLLPLRTRIDFANDSLELLAVSGKINQSKGDADAASWLPPNKAFRCAYIARQISVKLKYKLWVTPPEQTAMQTVLNSCPDQQLID